MALHIAGTPAVPPRLTPKEFEEREAIHQELAEALAHQVYQLAQQQRAGDIDLYLSAINVVVGDKSPKEARMILDKANEFFTEQYYTAIRDRGERPEISHQIIKRVGHENSETITRIAEGLDIEKVADDLWELYSGAYPDKNERITEILLSCTERQLHALREEFFLNPYKNLARQAYAILNPKEEEVQAPVRRSIGGSEVGAQKKREAFRVRDDSRALKYLFLGRSVQEMNLIKRFYCDFGSLEQDEREIGIFAHLQKRLKPIQIDRLGTLLDGWSPQQEARELHEMLYPSTLRPGIEDELSDPVEPVDRDYTQGIGIYLRKFKKNRMWRDNDSVYHRTLNCYELIAERVSALTPQRFLLTNQVLYEQYQYELDPSLFLSLGTPDPRMLALVIAERMHCSSDLLEAISPMLYGEPSHCLQVQQAYEVLFARRLADDLNECFPDKKASHEAHTREMVIDRFLNGQGRIPVHVDILARYRGEEPLCTVWDYSYQGTEEDEQEAITFAGILDYDGAVGERDDAIYEALASRDTDQLHTLERAFYDLTDPPMSLRDALRGCMAPHVFQKAQLLFAGVELSQKVEELYTQPILTSELAELPPSLLATINTGFKEAYSIDLPSFLIEQFGAPNQEDILLENLSVAVLPQVYTSRRSLRDASRMTQDDIDVVRAEVSSSLQYAMGFERGFDKTFPRLRLHIKYAAARMAVTPPVFAELLLYLEGISPDVNDRLIQYFDAVDIEMVLELLREYKHDQRMIEETFDLLCPENGLRTSIKQMKVDLDVINEALLHLDGYSAKDVADELHSIISNTPVESLGSELVAVFAPPSEEQPNPRIPADVNWMDEMNYQILLAYHRQYDEDLMKVAWDKHLPPETLSSLTKRLFGEEVCGTAEELFAVLKASKEGTPHGISAEKRICSQVESRGIRFRGLLVRAYNSYWAHQPGCSNLLDDVATYIEDAGIKRKLHALLIGVGVDARRKKVVVQESLEL